MAVFFSSRPGCFERHLQRRYHNPLFPEALRNPSQEEVNQARERDRGELEGFYRDLQVTLNEVGNLPPQVESQTVLGFKERLDRLYEVCAGLPGDHDQDKRGIRKVYDLIVARIREGAEHDPYAKFQLDQEQEAREMHRKLLEFPLLVHLLRPDTPIEADHLVPTLLSETDEAVQAVMALFSPDQQAELRASARQLLDRLEAAGQPQPAARVRLQAMETPLQV